ncbi:5-dehydro-4-deoxyglucarate dehydratase [Nakamurella endophytica]|uniref:Probable 5-dehydro-4-deoxyglucarate dehydratase n=1 Tax=Nakamurella endophytica TaxID=1748367 RepID=A0A917SU78_9ACTN|nr:5-dehydro-4-deoxyglucarate dehydratase [Nakamurella endophytica]GGL98659.1 putative 5-dehydro-4-deoxyglucarate dehydratase [Nakamurella endophytica]
MLSGLLFFPVTPYRPDGGIHTDVLAEHIRRGVAAGAGAVFVACGTGEFHALGEQEYRTVLRVAVETVGGAVPVYAGVGGSVATAKELAAVAGSTGVDGLLLLPPYLVRGPVSGLVSYVRDVTSSSPLPVIVYQRDMAVFTPAAAAEVATFPTVVGFKDGIGDLVLLADIIRAVRKVDRTGQFQFFNGLPTAELSQVTYGRIGVDLYSSAVFAFAPEIALAFYAALQAGDEYTIDVLLREFYEPFGQLRLRVPGHAVGLVKAGARMRGLDVGGVRPPLMDPDEDDLRALEALLHRGLRALHELGSPDLPSLETDLRGAVRSAS